MNKARLPIVIEKESLSDYSNPEMIVAAYNAAKRELAERELQ